MRRQLGRALCITFSLSLILTFIVQTTSRASTRDDRETSQQAAVHDAMRKLWEDHITWTRVFILSAAADLPDKATATDRLLQNQVDIRNAIKPYGEAAGNKLTALLKEHITTAAEVVAASKANHQAKLANANKRWFANAEQIAGFLSTANPKNWSQAEMRSMMHEHLNLTTQEAVALTMGLVKQFPDKFK